MNQKLWIVVAGTLTVSVVAQAQPEAPQPEPDAATIASARELEASIGGRTTLELKFEDATREQVLEAIKQSSGLKFSSVWEPLPGIRLASSPGAPPTDERRFRADVAKSDFWWALRTWSRTREAQEQQASAQAQRQQSQDPQPTRPQEAAPDSAEFKAWQVALNAWSQREKLRTPLLFPGYGLSVDFNDNSRLWGLSPESPVAQGRAVNAWPCLILATGFQRAQSLSIKGDEPIAPAVAPIVAPAVPQKAEVISASAQGEEVAGGRLSDSLALSLSVFLEPKLVQRSEVTLKIREARDDAGQDLLAEREKPNAARGATYVPSTSLTNGVLKRAVQLKPRLSTSTKLAKVSGVVQIRVPFQVQERQITDLSNSLSLPVALAGTQGQVQIETPSLENGHWIFRTSAKAHPKHGWRRILGGSTPRNYMALGASLLPPLKSVTFTDVQGRTWRPIKISGGRGFSGLSGAGVPLTSPPTPIPDDFDYHEEDVSVLFPVDMERAQRPGWEPSKDNLEYVTTASGGGGLTMAPWPSTKLSPTEAGAIKFTRATFTTESDWRTIEVPFEFKDLPLPPR
jgi:hypothetical protein